MAHFVYVLKCSDDSLYTGYTTDIDKREDEHNGVGDTKSAKKLGAKYTRPRRPVKLVYYEEFENRSKATKREYAIKQLTRVQKQKLIAEK